MEIWQAILLALIAGTPGVITALATRKKADSDAAQSVSNAVSVLMDPLTKRVESLAKDLEAERVCNTDLRAEVAELKLEMDAVRRENVALREWAHRLAEWGRKYAPRDVPAPALKIIHGKADL